MAPFRIKYERRTKSACRAGVPAHEAEGEAGGDNDKPALQPASSSSPVLTLRSSLEFVQFVENTKEDGSAGDDHHAPLTVVLFHAHYCKLCQKTNIQYRKVAHRYRDNHQPSDDDSVTFARLETSHMTLAQLRALGVTRFPFCQVYRHGVCVASFSTKGQSLEPLLLDTLQSCRQRSTLDWKNFARLYREEIEANRQARMRLRVEPTLQGPVKTMTQPSHLPQLVLDDYQALVGDSSHLDADNDDNDVTVLVVVLFHNHFFDAGRRAQHQFRRIADHYLKQQAKKQQQSEKEEDDRGAVTVIQFARMETSVLGEDQLRDLGLRNDQKMTTPFVQIYRNQRLVQAFDTGPTYLFKRHVYDAIDSSLREITDNEGPAFASSATTRQKSRIAPSEAAEHNQRVLNQLRTHR